MYVERFFFLSLISIPKRFQAVPAPKSLEAATLSDDISKIRVAADFAIYYV